MLTLNEQLAKYAAYHRDSRNIVTHFIGVPMITLAVAILLSRPSMVVGIGLVNLSPALVMVVLFTWYYLSLDRVYGLLMGATLLVFLAIGQWLATMQTGTWLGVGVALFVVGWIIQFVGHYYEGRKPAFVDDIMGLAIGPLFVLAEFGFLFGLRQDVQHAIEQVAGPVRQNKWGQPSQQHI